MFSAQSAVLRHIIDMSTDMKKAEVRTETCQQWKWTPLFVYSTCLQKETKSNIWNKEDRLSLIFYFSIVLQSVCRKKKSITTTIPVASALTIPDMFFALSHQKLWRHPDRMWRVVVLPQPVQLASIYIFKHKEQVNKSAHCLLHASTDNADECSS